MPRYPDYDEARLHDSPERDAGREDHGKGIPLNANPFRGGMHTTQAQLWEDGWMAADDDAFDRAEYANDVAEYASENGRAAA